VLFEVTDLVDLPSRLACSMLVQTLETLRKDLESVRVDLGLPSAPCSVSRDTDTRTAGSQLLVDDSLRQKLFHILDNSAVTGDNEPGPSSGSCHSGFPPIGAHFNLNSDGTWFIEGDDKATAAGVSSQHSDVVEAALSPSDIDEDLVKELSQVGAE
jgi:hypothetical protein